MVHGRAGRLARVEPLEVRLLGILGRDHGRQDGEEDEEGDEPGPDHRGRVPDQLVERVAPEAGRRLELDLPGFELDDAHE
jgi:hypothetical protein